MIIELICAPLMLLLRGILSLLPVLTYLPNSLVSTVDLLLKAIQFFPNDVWIICIGSFVFWFTVHLIIGLIKFVLSWIPFISMGN